MWYPGIFFSISVLFGVPCHSFQLAPDTRLWQEVPILLLKVPGFFGHRIHFGSDQWIQGHLVKVLCWLSREVFELLSVLFTFSSNTSRENQQTTFTKWLWIQSVYGDRKIKFIPRSRAKKTIQILQNYSNFSHLYFVGEKARHFQIP